jgi:hypothetical protein
LIEEAEDRRQINDDIRRHKLYEEIMHATHWNEVLEKCIWAHQILVGTEYKYCAYPFFLIAELLEKCGLPKLTYLKRWHFDYASMSFNTVRIRAAYFFSVAIVIVIANFSGLLIEVFLRAFVADAFGRTNIVKVQNSMIQHEFQVGHIVFAAACCLCVTAVLTSWPSTNLNCHTFLGIWWIIMGIIGFLVAMMHPLLTLIFLPMQMMACGLMMQGLIELMLDAFRHPPLPKFQAAVVTRVFGFMDTMIPSDPNKDPDLDVVTVAEKAQTYWHNRKQCMYRACITCDWLMRFGELVPILAGFSGFYFHWFIALAPDGRGPGGAFLRSYVWGNMGAVGMAAFIYMICTMHFSFWNVTYYDDTDENGERTHSDKAEEDVFDYQSCQNRMVYHIRRMHVNPGKIHHIYRFFLDRPQCLDGIEEDTLTDIKARQYRKRLVDFTHCWFWQPYLLFLLCQFIWGLSCWLLWTGDLEALGTYLAGGDQSHDTHAGKKFQFALISLVLVFVIGYSSRIVNIRFPGVIDGAYIFAIVFFLAVGVGLACVGAADLGHGKAGLIVSNDTITNAEEQCRQAGAIDGPAWPYCGWKGTEDEYSICKMEWGSRAAPVNALDLALLSGVVYEDQCWDDGKSPSIEAELKRLFPDVEVELEFCNDYHDFPRLASFYFPGHGAGTEGTRVVSYKGTSTPLDILMDATLWSTVKVMQWFKTVLPVIELLPPDQVQWMMLVGHFPGLLKQEQALWSNMQHNLSSLLLGNFSGRLPNKEWVDFPDKYLGSESVSRKTSVSELKKNWQSKKADVILTGHSLGGGLAQTLATRNRKPALVWSAPGIGFSARRFQMYNPDAPSSRSQDLIVQDSSPRAMLHTGMQAAMREVVVVVPQDDLVPRVDTQAGMIQRISCREKDFGFGQAATCHGINKTACEVWRVCGDPRPRLIDCQAFLPDDIHELRRTLGSWFSQDDDIQD